MKNTNKSFFEKKGYTIVKSMNTGNVIVKKGNTSYCDKSLTALKKRLF